MKQNKKKCKKINIPICNNPPSVIIIYSTFKLTS